MKKAFLKILQYSQESCRAATLKNRLQHRCFPLNVTKFLRTLILKNICEWLLLIFWNSYRTAVSSCFCIDFLLSLDNLLTNYEQLSYWQFNRHLSVCVSLAKDWFMLQKKFNQDWTTYFFKQKIDSFWFSGLNLPQKRCFQSKTEKMNRTIEFSIFELVLVPNFSLNWQCWFFGPNLPKKVFPI